MTSRPVVKINRDASDLAFKVGQSLQKKAIASASVHAAVQCGDGEVIVNIEHVRAALIQLLSETLQRELESAGNEPRRQKRLSA